jgi:predicted phosphate transport protein (TIGR00153 family)
MSTIILDCSDLLIELTKTSDKEKREEVYRRIKGLETDGDGIVAKLFNKLNNTFITPFDREDINALGDELDDVLDSMNSAAKRVIMYQPDVMPEQSTELALLLRKNCELMHSAIDQLPKIRKNSKEVKKICTQMHIFENEADELYENFIKDIFEKEKDAIELIKIKEIVQEIERAIDKADGIGKIIKYMIVKYV